MSYILCVDDEPSISTLIRQILKMAGHEVAIANDGFEALKMVGEREPDLIVLDRSMPGMDGIAVCREIKANPFLSRVPILILTALATVDFKVEGFDAGADDYLVKPFDPRELTARVASLLRLVAREGDRNPSSGLPGGRAIAADIEGRVARGESGAVIYIDIDSFKPFADTFGFAAADEVITATGKMLGELVAPCGDFAGHIGGDDFLLVCAPERAHDLAQVAAQRFTPIVAGAVGQENAERGIFTGIDRKGNPKQFKLASLTSVVVPIEPENWVSLAHLGEAAATWKLAAKSNGGGRIVEAR